jgi:hypothetical protein
LGAEALVPSACRRKKRLHERTQEKIVTAQTAFRSLPEEAKEYFAETK